MAFPEVTLFLNPVPLRFSQVPTVEEPVNFRPRKPASCQRSMSWTLPATASVAGKGAGAAVTLRVETARVRRVVNCIFIGALMVIWREALKLEV